VRTVFVEADIVGELSHLSCIEYVMTNEKIQAYKITEKQVREILVKVGFAAVTGGGTAVDDGVSTLSGGWRMKLALARAMLQKADILLLDEPTNHLDVMNVRWTLDYLKSLVDVTCVMVSHDSKLLNEVCSNILQIKDLKLKAFKGTLDDFVKANPDAASFFELKKTKLSFKFPQPVRYCALPVSCGYLLRRLPMMRKIVECTAMCVRVRSAMRAQQYDDANMHHYHEAVLSVRHCALPRFA
jgi:elongation factor 3